MIGQWKVEIPLLFYIVIDLSYDYHTFKKYDLKHIGNTQNQDTIPQHTTDHQPPTTTTPPYTDHQPPPHLFPTSLLDERDQKSPTCC